MQALHFWDYRKDKWKCILNVNYNKNTKSASVALFTSNKNQAFILKYNKIPYVKSTDPYEVSLAESRNNFRRKIKKNPESYKLLIQYANDNGCSNLFEYVDKEEKNLILHTMLYQKYDQKHINEDYLIDTQPKHLQQYYSPISISMQDL